MHELSQTDSMS